MIFEKNLPQRMDLLAIWGLLSKLFFKINENKNITEKKNFSDPF
jgi:hypothetical protein